MLFLDDRFDLVVPSPPSVETDMVGGTSEDEFPRVAVEEVEVDETSLEEPSSLCFLAFLDFPLAESLMVFERLGWGAKRSRTRERCNTRPMSRQVDSLEPQRGVTD